MCPVLANRAWAEKLIHLAVFQYARLINELVLRKIGIIVEVKSRRWIMAE